MERSKTVDVKARCASGSCGDILEEVKEKLEYALLLFLNKLFLVIHYG